MTKKEMLEKVPNNSFNRGAIDMLDFIAKNEGWEESEKFYFEKYFNL